ncbi:MAG: polysaccharide biosynthesis/export family protein [bacterium]
MAGRNHDHHHKAGGVRFRVIVRQLLVLAFITSLFGIHNLWGQPKSLSPAKSLSPEEGKEIKKEKKPKAKITEQKKTEEPEEELILPGDKLCIRLVEDQEYGGIVTVSSTGYISLPLLNEIKVTGLVPSELANILKYTLESRYFQKATVTVFFYDKIPFFESSPDNLADGMAGVDLEGKKKPGKIYIVGEISQPGAITIPEDEVFTVGKAIISAGGFTEFAKEKKVMLVRLKSSGEREVRIVNAVKIIKEGHLEEDVMVRDGDWIIVSQSFFKF